MHLLSQTKNVSSEMKLLYKAFKPNIKNRPASVTSSHYFLLSIHKKGRIVFDTFHQIC
jgi:hypothetical protein